MYSFSDQLTDLWCSMMAALLVLFSLSEKSLLPTADANAYLKRSDLQGKGSVVYFKKVSLITLQNQPECAIPYDKCILKNGTLSVDYQKHKSQRATENINPPVIKDGTLCFFKSVIKTSHQRWHTLFF
jgi:hypothetical protein